MLNIDKDRLANEISNRKRAERRAREAENVLLSGIENLVDVLVFSIDNEYRLRIFNTAFKKATQQAYGLKITIGMNLFDFVTNEADKEKIKNNVDKALVGENHMTVEEFGEVEKNYFETRYTPVYLNRKVIGVTVISTNVTSRVKYEEEIKGLNADLEAFAHSAAHDLQAPLRSITHFSKILLEGNGSDQKNKRLIENINRNATQMAELISDLLLFAKIEKQRFNKAVVNPGPIIDKVIKEIRSQNPNKKMRFVIDNLYEIPCDPKMINIIFTNLLSNAIKYSGTRKISKVTIGSSKKPNEVVFYVKDNGVGFSMAHYDKLFEVFQRLHKPSEFEGNGLGLSIVKRIVVKHGGKVWAESDKTGAKFFFCLPLNMD